MPKKSALQEPLTTDAVMPVRATAKPVAPDLQEKLDMILVYLHRMDRRDRLRTWGGFFRGMLGLIPILLVVWSVWYFYAYGDEFMSKITQEAVRQSAEYTQGSLMEQLEEAMKTQQGR